MKLSKLGCAALAFLLLAPAGRAQGQGIDALAAMDGNGDGAVTRSEAASARAAMFLRGDADGDGFLSQAEQARLRQGQRSRRRANPDADGDGRISRAEFDAMPFRGFDLADADHSGVVTADELAALRARFGGG